MEICLKKAIKWHLFRLLTQKIFAGRGLPPTPALGWTFFFRSFLAGITGKGLPNETRFRKFFLKKLIFWTRTFTFCGFDGFLKIEYGWSEPKSKGTFNI